ncbi:MAG: hypothetical protein Q7K65_04205 [Candidatus Buchananbacteria bacterium]|nr:hypothetical protein [Candidatus Buchananbacteria bacterium]
MKLNLKIILCFMLLATILSVTTIHQVQANVILDGIEDAVRGTDLPSGEIILPVAIGRIIQLLLSFLGVLAVVLIIYAGYMWTTAGGDSAKVTKAKDYIKNAIIGIIIIMASYIITSYVIERITETLQ